MDRVSVSFRTDRAKVERLDQFAQLSRRDRTQILDEAIEQYIDWQDRNLRKVDEGLRALEAKDFASDEQVESEFAKWQNL